MSEEAGELLKELVDEAPSYVTSQSDSSGQSSATLSDAPGAISLSNGGTPMSSTKLKYKLIFYTHLGLFRISETASLTLFISAVFLLIIKYTGSFTFIPLISLMISQNMVRFLHE